MILDIIQTMLLLACIGFIFFIYRRLTSIEKQPAKIDNQEDKPAELPEPDIQEIREALKAHIERESSVLELDDFRGGWIYMSILVGYGHYKIWLVIWIGGNLDIIATNLMIGEQYLETFERLKENRHKIEWLFPEEEIICGLIGGNRRIGIEKRVDLSQRSNWHEISVWARENLEKLFWVISIHDKLSSGDTRLHLMMITP